MKASLNLALKYIGKNKKRSIGTIIGITIITILIISIMLLLNVYQNYMINIIRGTANWEVKFNNIEYEKLYGLTENSDIKNIAIIQNIETSITNSNINSNAITEYIDLKAYDDNAFENFGITLIEGRFPKNSNEIVISRNFWNKTDKITINDKDYTIVGTIEPTEYDSVDLNTVIISAITYLDKEELKSVDLIDVSVNFNNIGDIYEKTNEIANVLKLYPNDSSKNQNLEFNKNLLRYYSVWNMNSENDKQIIAIIALLILIILLVSVVLIYSIFNISVQERKKEFAMLNSIGATKNQITKMILYEAIILLLLSMLIGLVISIVLLNVVVNYIGNVLSSIDIYWANAYEDTLINIPYIKILIALILISITTIISALIPAMQSRKNTILEELKGKSFKKIKNNVLRKNKKTIEQILTYRSQKQNPHKYRTIIISVMLSVSLFLLIQGYTENIYNFLDRKVINYSVSVDKKYVEEVKQSFLNTGVCEEIYTYTHNNFYTQLNEAKINDSLKQAFIDCPSLKKQVFYTTIENELKVDIYAVSDEELEIYLKEIGLKTLEKNECILVNYSNVKTDYYDGVYMTNYKEGDCIELYLNSKGDGTFNINSMDDFQNIDNFEPYGDKQRKVDLKVTKIANKLPKTIKQPSSSIPYLGIIVKEESLDNIYRYLINAENDNTYVNLKTNIEVYSDNRKELDEQLEKLILKYNLELNEIIGIYLDPDYDISQIKISEIFIYIITALISVVTLINIINVVINDINTRRSYFYVMISIGMQKKQIIKMIIKEYAKYFTISLLYGILISIIITYISYNNMYNHELYKFKIPILAILITFAVLILILFLILRYVDRMIKDENIINNIKNIER